MTESPKSKRVPDSERRDGDRREAATATCRVCGTQWQHWRKGPVPSYCPAHRPSNNRARDRRTAEARGESDLVELLGVAGREWSAPLTKSMKAALLAVGLAMHPDRRVAADLVGLGEERGLGSLEKLARKHWRELIEGGSGPLLQLLDGSMKLNALHAVLDARSIPAGQRAQANQRAAQTIEALHKTNSTAYAGPVQVVWEETED